MLDLRAQILALLKSRAGGPVPVFDQYPEENAVFPCVSFFESANDEYRRAGGAEHLTRIAYTVDIWGHEWADVDTILNSINTGMQALGFRRETCMDSPENGIKHKNVRFTGILDQTGRVFQESIGMAQW